MSDHRNLSHDRNAVVLAVVLVFGASMLDKAVPPFGIPVALLVIFLLCRRYRSTAWRTGLKAPGSWAKTAGTGLVVAITLQAFAIFVLSPTLHWLGLPATESGAFAHVEGNHSRLVVFLFVSWTTAGFGEELVFRGFLMEQVTWVFNGLRHKWIIGLLLSSMLFGLLHIDRGPEAILLTGFAGFAYGLLYLWSQRNLWACYFAHAFTDTIAFLVIYSGLWRYIL